MKKPIDPTKLSNITLSIPDREPYESKATQKQKAWLWHHGIDTDIIDDLGRNQASSMIEQIQNRPKILLRKKERAPQLEKFVSAFDQKIAALKAKWKDQQKTSSSNRITTKIDF